MLTDWGSGAVAGVATVLGSAATAPAILEKQLRDQGETDDISHLLVHQSRTRMGSTELVYTAVPVGTWRRYQQLAGEHPCLLLIHDWVRCLVQWTRRHGPGDGSMMIMHPRGLDVLALEHGRVCFLERFRALQGESDAWHRIGTRAAATHREHRSTNATDRSQAGSVVLWVLQGAEADLPQLVQGLAGPGIDALWAEAPEVVRAALGAEAPEVKRLTAAGLASAMPLARCVSRPLDKAAALADRWVPAIGLSALTLSAILAATAGVMHHRSQQGLGGPDLGTEARASWQALNASVQQADRLAEQQKNTRQWLQQRLDGARVPDANDMLARLRHALPAGLVIDEVGLVVEKDSHLLTVVGHAIDVEASLRSEAGFAQALRAEGFTLQKRDLVLRDGQPRFKLSMTWSAS